VTFSIRTGSGVYELFRGAITAEQLASSETQAADFVRTRKSDNPHLAVSMGHAADTGNAAQSPLRTVLEWFTRAEVPRIGT
jgi:hypothetical protein